MDIPQSQIFVDSVFALLVFPLLIPLGLQICSVIGRQEGVWQREERSAINLVRSSRLLYLSFYSRAYTRDNIERFCKRNSTITPL